MNDEAKTSAQKWDEESRLRYQALGLKYVSPEERVKEQQDVWTFKNEEHQYEIYITAFLDILGYKNMVDSLGDAAPKNIVHLVIDAISKFGAPSLEQVQFNIFHDSITIWTPYEGFWSINDVFCAARELRGTFFKRGIVLRGSICSGKHFFKRNICVSPALIRAYETESKIAIYPRIVIDESIVQSYKSSIQSEQSVHGHNYEFVHYQRPNALQPVNHFVSSDTVMTDFDGQKILNPFLNHMGVEYLFNGRPGMEVAFDPQVYKTQAILFLNEYRVTLEKEYEKIKEKTVVKAKWHYMISQFNSFVSELRLSQQERNDLKLRVL